MTAAKPPTSSEPSRPGVVHWAIVIFGSVQVALWGIGRIETLKFPYWVLVVPSWGIALLCFLVGAYLLDILKTKKDTRVTVYLVASFVFATIFLALDRFV